MTVMTDPGSHPAPALAVRGLSKRYGIRRRWALRDATFEVGPGQVAAVVGPNGAGKSTLLRIVAGLEPPTSGSAQVSGADIHADRPGALRKVGYVAQESPVYRRLSVNEHLRLAAALRRNFDLRAARARLEGARVSLEARGQELSGGQRAQLAITIALACHASVLVLDEPLASLDPLARSELIRSLRATVMADGTSIVISSHIITDIEPIADSVVILAAGRLVLASSVHEAISTHRVSEKATLESTVGVFPSPDGAQLALIRSSSPALGREPRLDDLVKGYLAGVSARDGMDGP